MAQEGISPKFYPKTKITAQQDVFFNTTVPDPYRWLEDDKSDETANWVQEENAVTDAYLAKIPFRKALKDRLTEIWNYEKYSAPFKEGGFLYYEKNNGLQNQDILYRQQEGGTPEVFLDPNNFSADGTTSLTNIAFTKDGSRCAYSISEGGSDWGKMVVLMTATKEQLGDTLVDIKFSGIAWKGNEGIYYSTYNVPAAGSQLSAKTDQHKLYYHAIGTPQAKDVLVFGGEKLIRRYVSAYITEDQRYLVINAANSTTGNELYIQDLTKPGSPVIPVVTGFDSEQRVLYSNGDQLYIVTNLGAPNRKVVVTCAENPGTGGWKDLIPERKFPLTASMAGGKIFAHYLKDAVSQVFQFNLEGKQEKHVELPGLGSANGFYAKANQQELYYSFSSYVYPPTIFKYDIHSGKSSLFKRPVIRFHPDKYESQQVFYKSKDGTRIPMIITHKKGLVRNGKNPTILYGYGGFNISLTPGFRVSNVVFMENGGVYAVANLRGGGEYGDQWHDAGIKLHKQNVFDDFIAAAEYLVSEKITASKFLAISGGSNGGLLVGACMTQRPELFRVALPAVGVLDMLRYHKFTAGAGWAYDYGTADDNVEMFQYLLKYSPVHNVKASTCYPSTMITTGDHDDRVVPAHSFKFGAALQASQGCHNPTLIRIETKAGHGAGKPTTMVIDETADRFAFLFYEMGLDYKTP